MFHNIQNAFNSASHLTRDMISGKAGMVERNNYTSNMRLALKRYIRPGQPLITLNKYRVHYGNFKHMDMIYNELFNKEAYKFKTDNASPFIIDAGANIGLATLYYKMLYPGAHIMAFEPDPVTFAVLKRNIETNNIKEVKLFNKALYDHQGSIDFYRETGKECSWASSIYDSGFINYGYSHEKLSVACDVLSSYIDRRVDMLKVDVEGAETEVITELNASGKLSLVDRLIVEYHHFIRGKDGLIKILDILNDAGYACCDINGDKIDPEGCAQNVLLIIANGIYRRRELY